VGGTGPVGLWMRGLPPQPARPPLDGSASCDVAVVGAGLTGLWTAYYLRRTDPSLRVLVLEAERVGFGASGRNGGWLTSSPPGVRATWAAAAGPTAVHAMQAALDATVDEVLDVCRRAGIDARARKGGELRVARTPAEAERLHRSVTADQAYGDRVQLLTPDEADARIRVARVELASYRRACATLDPARLVTGLAEAVERMGAVIHESTRVTAVRPGLVITDRGRVTADVVVRATEGFTSRLPGLRRWWLPMNSSLIATEPLPDEVWARLGWAGGEALGDAAHVFMYAQRTGDGRVVLGGRGVPYRYGSRTDAAGETAPRTVRHLRSVLADLFPDLAGVRVEHAWSGVLAVPRDWCGCVAFDPVARTAHAGGYAGHGVAASNLAGRILTDLVLGRQTALTTLPWVGWPARRWEPEPLRFLGVRGLYAAYRLADRLERNAARTSLVARLADRASGRR
jgi:glycine/D-amino acid oxidase-like deaminating enzyme